MVIYGHFKIRHNKSRSCFISSVFILTGILHLVHLKSTLSNILANSQNIKKKNKKKHKNLRGIETIHLSPRPLLMLFCLPLERLAEVYKRGLLIVTEIVDCNDNVMCNLFSYVQ